MTEIPPTSLADRARLHRALGDERRLRIVDALRLSDRRVGELGRLTDLPTNLLAFHLEVLEEAGAIARRASQGDRRRRYVTLRPGVAARLGAPPSPPTPAERVLFLCTANSARSPLAAQLWQARTGRPALSAGTDPAARVHPRAVAVARRHGLDLDHAAPRHYAALPAAPDLVVSVCDRAHESARDLAAPRLHWSVPDPVPAGAKAFAAVFTELAERIDRLAEAA